MNLISRKKNSVHDKYIKHTNFRKKKLMEKRKLILKVVSNLNRYIKVYYIKVS